MSWVALTSMYEELTCFPRQRIEFDVAGGKARNRGEVLWPRGGWGRVDGAAIFASPSGGEPLFDIHLTNPLSVMRSDEVKFSPYSIDIDLDGFGKGAEALLFGENFLGPSPKPAEPMPFPEALVLPSMSCPICGKDLRFGEMCWHE